MKQTKRFLTVLLSGLFFAGLQAQTYVDVVNDLYHDDALVDLQYNSTHLKPEGVFKLGDGFNVLSFDESNGSVLTSKFVIASGKVITPKCIAQAGTQCLVFSEDANNVYYTSLNTATGVIAYTKSFARTDGFFYTQLSPVDADYDGSTYIYLLMRGKDFGSTTTWNTSYVKINVSSGALLSGAVYGGSSYDLVPNDIEYVDATHLYVSGSWRLHSPTTNPMKYMLFNIFGYPGGFKIFDLPLTNNRPRSLYVNYRNGYVYLLGDSYHPSFQAAGPVVVLRMTDNNNGTMTINNQYFYGSPGATFFIHDVQEEYGVLIASGERPEFISGVASAPRNFLFNSLINTAMMSEYTLGGNVNIRTVYSGISLRMFSVAKEDNMTLSMNDLRTDVNATTLGCYTPLSLSNPSESVSVTPYSFGSKSFSPTVSPVSTVDSYKTYTWYNSCNTRLAGPVSEEAATPGVKYYPNPSEGMVHLENIEAVSHIRLYDTEGRLLIDMAPEPGTPSTDIDLTSLTPGLYLLQMEQNGEQIRAKLIRK